MIGARPERRFVEEHELRPPHQRARDREHLLLAAAHASRFLVATIGEAREDLEPAVDVDGHLAVAPRVRAETQVLVDRELGKGPAPLRHVRDPGTRDSLGLRAQHRNTVERERRPGRE